MLIHRSSTTHPPLTHHLVGAPLTPSSPLRHTQYNSVKAGKSGVQLGDGSNKNKKSKVAPEPGEEGGGGGAIVYPYESKATGKKKKTHRVNFTTFLENMT